MRQTTLATAGFDRYAKTTRREAFLSEMEAVVPWAAFLCLIEPFYPKAGNGRPPIGLERMLRIYFLQQWFDLSDPGAEEALYDSADEAENLGEVSALPKEYPGWMFEQQSGRARQLAAARRL